MVQEILPVCKNFDNQARSDRSKTVNSEAMLQAIEANLESSTWRVSVKLSISQLSIVGHFHNYIQSC